MRRKTWKLAAVTLGLSISASAIAFAQTPGWSLTGEGWRYTTAENRQQTASWLQDTDGRWYHFDSNGIMQTGWFQDGNGVWYYLATDSGAMKTGWFQDGNGVWYYLSDGSGAMKTGWFQDGNGVWYYLSDGSGAMKTGWYQDAAGKWYYLADNGAMKTGLIRVGQAVYYMEPGGALFVGDKEIGGVVYHFTENGTVGGTPPIKPAPTVSGGGGHSSSGSGGGPSKEWRRVKDAVQKDIRAAVAQTGGSEYIKSASVSGQSVTVTIVPTATMLEALPAAQSILSAFLSSGYVTEVTVSGPGGSAVIHGTEDLADAARKLGFSGNGSFSQAKGSYTAKLSYEGTLDYGKESGSLVYSVTVN